MVWIQITTYPLVILRLLIKSKAVVVAMTTVAFFPLTLVVGGGWVWRCLSLLISREGQGQCLEFLTLVQVINSVADMWLLLPFMPLYGKVDLDCLLNRRKNPRAFPENQFSALNIITLTAGNLHKSSIIFTANQKYDYFVDKEIEKSNLIKVTHCFSFLPQKKGGMVRLLCTHTQQPRSPAHLHFLLLILHSWGQTCHLPSL